MEIRNIYNKFLFIIIIVFILGFFLMFLCLNLFTYLFFLNINKIYYPTYFKKLFIKKQNPNLKNIKYLKFYVIKN